MNIETLIAAHETAKAARQSLAVDVLFSKSASKALRAAERAERNALAAVRMVRPEYLKHDPVVGHTPWFYR